MLSYKGNEFQTRRVGVRESKKDCIRQRERNNREGTRGIGSEKIKALNL